MANEFGNLGTLSPEDYAQQQQITRQQRLAEMLMSQNQQPQGQMVSGRYVAPSFFQNILPLVNLYQGQRLAEKADIKAAQLAEAIRDREAKETQKILGLQFGSPDYKAAIMPQIQRDDMGNVMPAVEQQIGQAPNSKEALFEALKAQGRTGQMIGQTLLAQKLKPPEQFNLRENEKRFIYNPETGTTTEIAKGNPKERVAAGVNAAAAERLGFPTNPDLWTDQQRQLIDQEVHKKIKAGASVNTNILSGESEYNKTFGKELAMEDKALIQVARSAPQILANNQRQLDLLKSGNVITGIGANQRLDLARFGQAIGVGGKGDIVANTQQLLAGRAGSVLDSIKASGLGAGNGFSNADRDFLEKAKLGGITYDATALKRQLEIENNVTKAMVNQYNQRIKDMPVAGNLKLQPVNVGNVEYLGPVK